MTSKILKSIGRILIATTIVFVFVIFLSWILGLFEPVTVNRYTIKNDNKTIIFQEMRHVGRTDFYKMVHDDILKHKEKDFLYLYEGIFDMPPKYFFDTEPFFPESFLMEQPFNLGNISEKDINADFSFQEIEKKIEHKVLIEKFELNNNQKLVSRTEDGVSFYEYIEDKETRNHVKYTEENLIRIRYFLNLIHMLPDEYVRERTKSIDTSIIIDERDQLIVDTVINSKRDNIYIQYGERHFKGFFEKLLAHDNNWKITKIDELVVL